MHIVNSRVTSRKTFFGCARRSWELSSLTKDWTRSLAVVGFPEGQLGEERFSQTCRDTLTSMVSFWDRRYPPEFRGMHLGFPSPHPHSTSGRLLRPRAWSSTLWYWRHCGVPRPHPCLILPWLSSIHLSPTHTAQRFFVVVVLFWFIYLFIFAILLLWFCSTSSDYFIYKLIFFQVYLLVF